MTRRGAGRGKDGGGGAEHGVLHIRGERAEAAEAKIERFLDRLVYLGRGGGTIIHGKSGGVLKRLAHHLLRNDPRVSDKVAARDETGRASAGAVTFTFL